jgi:endonuclease/exonuclease/phosphatase family metal-dependent hydrolase
MDGDSAPPAAHQPSTQLRVVSYNLNYGLAQNGAIDASTLDQVRQLEADIVLLQETNDEWARSIREEVGQTYPFQRYQPPGRYIAGGIGALSKYPILAEEVIDSPVNWFPAQRLVVDAPGGALQILNVHLRPAISESGSWVSGYFTTGPLREKEANAYQRVLDKALPTLVVGDFNEEDRGAAIGVFESWGLRNALPQLGSTKTTWRWTAYSVPLALRLDHILYDTRHFELVSGQVLAGGNSDHLPVEAVFVRTAQ